MADIRNLGLEFENAFVIFEISVLEFVLLQSYVQKQKSLNLGPKMPDLGNFELKVESYFVVFESAPSNLSHWKISWKNENV